MFTHTETSVYSSIDAKQTKFTKNLKDLKICVCRVTEGGRGVNYICENFTGSRPFCARLGYCLASTGNFQGLCPEGTQDNFDKIRVVAKLQNP
jgi:hypothetical protein